MNNQKISIIDSNKTVSETLADLRKVFKAWAIEEWEPIPGEDGRSYSVRYMRGRQWTEIQSQLQPTKAMNLRVCYQVITYLRLWENRGVTGIAKGVTFVGGLVPKSGGDKEDFEQSCAVLGVDPTATMEEIDKVYKVKAQFSHPDRFQDQEEKKQAEDRFKRIDKAYRYIKKVKGVR
jgi:DnaJ-domain-containing protein 1